MSVLPDSFYESIDWDSLSRHFKLLHEFRHNLKEMDGHDLMRQVEWYNERLRSLEVVRLCEALNVKAAYHKTIAEMIELEAVAILFLVPIHF